MDLLPFTGALWALLLALCALAGYYVFCRIREQPELITINQSIVQDIKPPPNTASRPPANIKQPYDAFLVLDVEATCQPGTDFNWPNEIIEWPVVLMKWSDRDASGRASELVVVDEFRSFVKPTWKPTLSQFCTHLTGITQEQVDSAPTFPEVMESFEAFLAKHGLFDPVKRRRLKRFTWCTDGPFDIRDFVIKQVFISKISLPDWLIGDVLDVRRMVTLWANWKALQNNEKPAPSWPRRPSLNISGQLRALSLPPFIGRQHSGIDDTRNIARIIKELARQRVRLEPNLAIHPGRRWHWMGRQGKILDTY